MYKRQIQTIWLLPVMALLSVLLRSNEKNGSAIAGKTAVFPAAANAIILSQTAAGDGTPIGNAISLVTTSTSVSYTHLSISFLYEVFVFLPYTSTFS